MAKRYQITSAFLLFLVTASSGTLLAQKPSIAGGDVIVNINPSTNSGTTTIYLRNDANEPKDVNEPLNVFLHIDEFILQTTKKSVSARVAFEYTDSQQKQQKGAFVQAEIRKGEVLVLSLEISGFSEAGEAHANLLNRDSRLASVKVIKFNPPFKVSLNSANPDNPELTFRRGKPGSLALKNEDPMTYPVEWYLVLSNTSTVLARDTVVLPGGSTVPVDFNVPSHAFARSFSGLIKEPKQEGRLVLQFAPPGEVGCPAPPTKTIPVKVTLQYWCPAQQLFASGVLALGALLAGGLCSVFLSLLIPHELQHIRLIQRIANLAQKTQMISTKVDSAVRVGVRVERLRLLELIRQVGAFTADASTVLKGYAGSLDLLDRRVSLVKELDEAAEVLHSLGGKSADAPPTVLENVRNQLDDATEVLRRAMPAEPDLQRAQELIQGAKDRLRNTASEDKQLASDLAARLADLINDYDKNGSVGKIKRCQGLRDQLKELFVPIESGEYKTESNIRPVHYHWLSSVIERLHILRNYIWVWECASADYQKHMEKECEKDLLPRLRLRTWNDLCRARRLVKEFEQHILPDEVRAELAKKAISVHSVPIEPLPNQLVRLEVCFNQHHLDECVAREEFTCVWDFGAIGKEEGWKIWHYFRNKNETRFSVSFRDERNGTTVRESEGDKKEATYSSTIQLREKGEKAWSAQRKLEVIQFLVAFGVALIGFITGARAKLMELDVFTGLVGVFLIGFGADTVKNIITKQSQGNA
jgi:hypothetical protein